MAQRDFSNIPSPVPFHQEPSAAALGLGDAAVQSNLHQFVASLWVHFFHAPAPAGHSGWKECEHRRRRHFYEAESEEIRDFIAGINPPMTQIVAHKHNVRYQYRNP